MSDKGKHIEFKNNPKPVLSDGEEDYPYPPLKKTLQNS